MFVKALSFVLNKCFRTREGVINRNMQIIWKCVYDIMDVLE